MLKTISEHEAALKEHIGLDIKSANAKDVLNAATTIAFSEAIFEKKVPSFLFDIFIPTKVLDKELDKPYPILDTIINRCSFAFSEVFEYKIQKLFLANYENGLLVYVAKIESKER